jgi:hypothetical protein
LPGGFNGAPVLNPAFSAGGFLSSYSGGRKFKVSGAGKEAPPEKPEEFRIDPAVVGEILAGEDEAGALSERIWKALEESGGGAFRGSELAAAALFFLNRGDFTGADRMLCFMEERDGSFFTGFLRGEYFYFQDMFTEAEFHYKISLGKDSGFWPAAYRLSALASTEVLQKYRAGQALESLSRTRDLYYEVFIGGFSPDYYLGALLKRNAG